MTTLTLEDARRVIAAAEKKADEIGQPMNIAVVDAGGNLIAHVRQDGAWIGSVNISINKAWTSKAFDISTKDLGDNSQPGQQFFGIQNTNGGKVAIFAGGIPLSRDGVVVGAVGVSGGSGEQDHSVAEAGVARLLSPASAARVGARLVREMHGFPRGIVVHSREAVHSAFVVRPASAGGRMPNDAEPRGEGRRSPAVLVAPPRESPLRRSADPVLALLLLEQHLLERPAVAHPSSRYLSFPSNSPNARSIRQPEVDQDTLRPAGPATGPAVAGARSRVGRAGAC